MKKIIQLTLLVTLAFIFTTESKAALLIEPVVGYNIGTKFDFESVENYTGGRGTAFGGRLGYQNLGLQLGLDYLNSSINMDDADINENVSLSEWGGFVGFEFPVLLRVYAGYIFSATGSSDTDLGKVDMIEGSGTKLGVGFTGLPLIDINFEYRTGGFDNYELNGVKQNKEAKYQSIMIGLSLPFTI
jgi:hypothetical protein